MHNDELVAKELVKLAESLVSNDRVALITPHGKVEKIRNDLYGLRRSIGVAYRKGHISEYDFDLFDGKVKQLVDDLKDLDDIVSNPSRVRDYLLGK